MEIGQTIQSTASNAAPNEITVDPAVISSDFETFLLMLTAQMENQDPLNPIESSDFAVQLATFSSVEQQVQTNDLLKGLTAQMGLMGMAQLAGWVGMEARVSAPAYFDGAPITLYPSPATTAEEATLVVRNEAGEVIERNTIAASDEPIVWAGVDDQGDPLPAGLFSFEVESYAHGDLIATSNVEIYSPITEAQNHAGQTILILEGGVEVPAISVNAIR